MRVVTLWVSLLVFVATSSYAGTVDSNGTYRGIISSVAVNFWSDVGVMLTGGASCNGQPMVLLLYTDPHYKDMMSVLMTAQATGTNVTINRMRDVIQSYYNGTYAYCTVTAVSLGDFPIW